MAADRWNVPLVHTMHTMARVKNQHLAPGDVPDLDRLIACADRAMLAAKRAGKNQVRIALLG